MKKYYVFLFGIIFIFIFTGCSFLSFNSPISYSEFDVGSSSSETDNIIPHEEDSSSDNNDVSSAESALSANEEKELFLDYWNDTHFGNIVNVPDDGDSFQQYDFWLISSLYLQKKFPDKKEFDTMVMNAILPTTIPIFYILCSVIQSIIVTIFQNQKTD